MVWFLLKRSRKFYKGFKLRYVLIRFVFEKLIFLIVLGRVDYMEVVWV